MHRFTGRFEPVPVQDLPPETALKVHGSVLVILVQPQHDSSDRKNLFS